MCDRKRLSSGGRTIQEPRRGRQIVSRFSLTAIFDGGGAGLLQHLVLSAYMLPPRIISKRNDDTLWWSNISSNGSYCLVDDQFDRKSFKRITSAQKSDSPTPMLTNKQNVSESLRTFPTQQNHHPDSWQPAVFLRSKVIVKYSHWHHGCARCWHESHLIWST